MVRAGVAEVQYEANKLKFASVKFQPMSENVTLRGCHLQLETKTCVSKQFLHFFLGLTLWIFMTLNLGGVKFI